MEKTSIKSYLNKLNSDLNLFLNKFKKVIVYDKPNDLELGLLRYDNPPSSDIAFLFKFEDDNIKYFHTIGMKFPIDIYFFNSIGKLVKCYKKVNPGVKLISSKFNSKYIIEVSNV